MTLTRREFLRAAAVVPVLGIAPSDSFSLKSGGVLTEHVAWVGQIPVRWVEPVQRRNGVNTVIWLSGFSDAAESMSPYLKELAGKGFLAISFDHTKHGLRGTQTADELWDWLVGDFRTRMWPILGQSVLEASLVIDWIQATFGNTPYVHVGGFSMGGDIAVAAAGHDPRISAVAAIVATADWLRPGMRDSWLPDQPLILQGEAGAEAQNFYDTFNPLTNLSRYDHAPAITFECAADDKHVPPDGAQRFRDALADLNAEAGANVRVQLHEGLVHDDLESDPVFWRESLEWFFRHSQG